MDGAGSLGHRWEWEPFGKTRADVGSTTSPFTYGGEQKDDETGLVNLRARYYDPAMGRFLSRDSLPGVMTVPQSWNRYSYVENDPINHLDPSGHKKKKIKWPGGQDPDDDSHQKKKAKACKNPGQYTGSCKGGPPYAADGEAQHEAKRAGQAAAAGNLSAAAAHLQAAQHFASIAGTAAAQTAAALSSYGWKCTTRLRPKCASDLRPNCTTWEVASRMISSVAWTIGSSGVSVREWASAPPGGPVGRPCGSCDR